MLRQLFEEALARRRGQYGDSNVRTAQAARDLGLFLSREGEASDARSALEEAVRIDEHTMGPTAAQMVADVEALAAVSELRLAEPLWKRAAASPDGAVAARALAALGQLREKAGDLPRAASYYRQALAKEERSAGLDHPRVAVRLNALARVVDVAEGIALLDRALEINRRRMGVRHQETATIELNLAGLLLNAGRANEAAKLSADAITTLEEILGTVS
jgi:tetratricopeptide (TPR) repeat protein